MDLFQRIEVVATPSDSFSEEPQKETQPEAIEKSGKIAKEQADKTEEVHSVNEMNASEQEKGSEEQAEAEEENIDPMSLLPPEAQGDQNGGPLGCCLGVMIGLLLSISIALVSRFYADSLAHVFNTSLSTIVRIAMIVLAVVAVIVCGYLGWKVGKKIYREYEPSPVKGQGTNTSRKKK